MYISNALQALDRDLAEAEEHHQRAHQGHGLCLNRLVELQAARLQAMEQRFEANLKARDMCQHSLQTCTATG